jgi:hypothetical protein
MDKDKTGVERGPLQYDRWRWTEDKKRNVENTVGYVDKALQALNACLKEKPGWAALSEGFDLLGNAIKELRPVVESGRESEQNTDIADFIEAYIDFTPGARESIEDVFLAYSKDFGGIIESRHVFTRRTLYLYGDRINTAVARIGKEKKVSRCFIGLKLRSFAPLPENEETKNG